MQPSENGAFAVALPVFAGPLDLLLSLIQEHKLDIFDIPISFVTDRYLEYMNRAQELNIDLAGEYLLMAATLAHIKSRMLLPREEAAEAIEGEAGPDPRSGSELVRSSAATSSSAAPGKTCRWPRRKSRTSSRPISPSTG